MANHLTEISTDKMREAYKTQYGFYPSPLGAAFGWASEKTVYNVFDCIYNFTDQFFSGSPWPFTVVEDTLKSIVSFAYNLMGKWAYCDWANQGDAIVKQFDNLIADYTKKIQNVVDQANAQLDQINTLIDQAKATLSNHEIRIKDLETQIPPNILAELNKYMRKLP